MASPVQVKHEHGNGDVFNAATDSEAEDIDDDNLQTRAPKFASQSKFPVGCKVLCNLRRSVTTEFRLAKSAYVEEVYIHVENGRRVYKVKSEVTTDYEATLYEDQLVYATSCPVRVTNIDTKETVDGLIIYPELEYEESMNQKVSYIVQYLDGNIVRIEHGVASERVKYRKNCGGKICGIENGGNVTTAEKKNIDEVTTEKGLSERAVIIENVEAASTLSPNHQVGTSSDKSAEVTSINSVIGRKGSEPCAASMAGEKEKVEIVLTQRTSIASSSIHTDSESTRWIPPFRKKSGLDGSD